MDFGKKILPELCLVDNFRLDQCIMELLNGSKIQMKYFLWEKTTSCCYCKALLFSGYLLELVKFS